MRVSLNVSKSAMHFFADATRVRAKLDENGNVMLLPTSRKVISGLDKLGEVARKFSRDTRKGTATVALNFATLTEGYYSVTPGKHGWMSLSKLDDNVTRTLATPVMRMSKKSG
jgi:hypothetical protein